MCSQPGEFERSKPRNARHSPDNSKPQTKAFPYPILSVNQILITAAVKNPTKAQMNNSETIG
jgi:hypothetical protein